MMAQGAGGVMTLGDDPLSGFADAPAVSLELVEEPVQQRRRKRKKPSPQVTPQEQLERDARALAAFGAVPSGVFGSIRYAVQVYLRRSALQAEVQSLERQQERAQSQADGALESVGEVLFDQRENPQLAGLQAAIQAVTHSGANMGSRLAEGQDAQQRTRGLVAEVQANLMSAQSLAEPLRRREAKYKGNLSAIKAQVRHLQGTMKQLEAQMKSVRGSKEAGAASHFQQLQAEWDARHGETESLQARIGPLEAELGEVRRELAKHMGIVAALHEEQRQITTRSDEEQRALRKSAGDAKSQYRKALRDLGQLGIENGFSVFAPNMSQAAELALETVKEKAAQITLHRHATDSFDHPVYSKGLKLLVGGLASCCIALTVLILRL